MSENLAARSTTHPAAKGCYWLAAVSLVVFICFMIADFQGFIWEMAFLGSLLLAILGNVISHPGSGQRRDGVPEVGRQPQQASVTATR